MSTTTNRSQQLKDQQKKREIEKQREIAKIYKLKMDKLKEEHNKELKQVVLNKEEELKKKREQSNEKLVKILLYTGIYASIASALAYVIITYVIVQGFQTSMDQQKQILFSVLGALFGILITFLLRSQGSELANQLETSKKVMEEYYSILNKSKSIKKLRTIRYYMWHNTIKDMFTKMTTIALNTYFLLYVFTEGNGDYALFLLAISNIFMFAGFGLIALAKTYNFYIEQHIPAIREIIIKLKEKQTKLDQVGSVPSEEK